MLEEETKANNDNVSDTNVTEIENQQDLQPEEKDADSLHIEKVITPKVWFDQNGVEHAFNPKTGEWEEVIPNALDNIKHELFCQKFCEMWSIYFWHGTESYIFAYWMDPNNRNHRQTANSCSSQIMRRPEVVKRIDQLLEQWGLTDQVADQEMLFVMKQKRDLPSKVAAIREYNKLRQRIIEKQKIDIEVVDVSKMTPEEQMQYLQSKLRNNGSAKNTGR